MKHVKKVLAFILVALMMMAMSTTAFASTLTINSTADTAQAQTETTAYKAWKLLEADMMNGGEPPTTDKETGDQTGGKVVYFTYKEAVVTALSSLFDFTRVGENNKWYATKKDTFTDAKQVVDLLSSKTEDELTALFGTPVEFAQTEPGGSAKAENMDDGYYYINSTLGDKIAVLTVGNTEINTKNSYPTDKKEIADNSKNAQIGDTIEYTLTVEIPESANQQIVLTDTMTQGLTFGAVGDVKADDTALADTAYTVSEVNAANNSFTITFPEATVIANKGKTITIAYTATLNEKAVVGTAEVNKLDMDYGNNYKAKPSEVETKTHSFSFEKIDTSVQLVGAEFELQDKGTAVALVVVTEGEEYRVATAAEVADSNVTTTTTIVTKGKAITIPAELPENVTVYHAGDKLTNEGLVTSGGRVLGVTATADTLARALDDAYAAAGQIHFDGAFMRSDIGKRALAVLEG